MKIHKNSFEPYFLIALFSLVATLSYYNISQSVSIVKYLFQWGLGSLLKNYSLYHQSFQEFLFQTAAYHTADSESGWRTLIFLWPLFIFSDILGGLSLKIACLFTITTSLIFLILFYWWVKKILGNQTALYAAFFLGFSSLFQEIARSGSYHAFSILLAMIWFILFFYCDKKQNIRNYFLLGLLTGLCWYGYGILRFLTIIVFIQVIFLKKTHKLASFITILSGIMIILVPGFLIKLQLQGIHLSQYHKPLYQLFFDQEASFQTKHGLIKEICTNLFTLGGRILGTRELLERRISQPHASLWNPLLVLPLLIGLWSTFKSRHHWPNGLLLLSALILYLLPCALTGSMGYMSGPRRAFLYLIPSYCFIGLGIKELFERVRSIKNPFPKWTLTFLLISSLFVILVQEMSFVKTFVLSSKRDIGLLSLAAQIEELNPTGDIYCLDGRPVLKGAPDSTLLQTILMKEGRVPFNIISKKFNIPLPKNTPKEFYLFKSPLIPDQKFYNWCEQNDLEALLLFQSPVTNIIDVDKEKYFKFYIVKKIN